MLTAMECVMFGHTALRWWRQNRSLANVERAVASMADESFPSLRDTRQLMESQLRDEKGKVHVCSPCKEGRLVRAGVTAHVWSVLPGEALYYQPGQRFFAPSPEALFLQMAAVLDEIDLVRLGFELCGWYSHYPQSERNVWKRHPLTNTASILQYLDGSGRVFGMAKARRALRYVCNDSYSPMETVVAMSLVLPRCKGGCGLPAPLMNAPIELNSAISPEGKGHFKCDLLWERQRVAVEYDSNEYHSTVESLNRDSVRRASLNALGYEVLSVTRNQVFDEESWSVTVKALCLMLGRDFRTAMKDYASKRTALVNRLLPQAGRLD